LELSEQGRNLIFAILGGLVIGTALAFVAVDGIPLYLLLLQDNRLVAMGWVWQLVTSIIIAPPTLTGLFDVAFNAMALAWLDGFFSLAYSKRQYYTVFLATAVAGNVFSLANGPREISFGASGGIFGLLAGVISFDVVTNRRLNPSLILWFTGVFLVSSFLFAYVDWLAHAGGALLGLVLGYAVGARRRKDDLVA
jgi:membrane associated rhomboid family serine protease